MVLQSRSSMLKAVCGGRPRAGAGQAPAAAATAVAAGAGGELEATRREIASLRAELGQPDTSPSPLMLGDQQLIQQPGAAAATAAAPMMLEDQARHAVGSTIACWGGRGHMPCRLLLPPPPSRTHTHTHTHTHRSDSARAPVPGWATAVGRGPRGSAAGRGPTGSPSGGSGIPCGG